MVTTQTLSAYESAMEETRRHNQAALDRTERLKPELDAADKIAQKFPEIYRYCQHYVSKHDGNGRLTVCLWHVKDRIADVLRYAAELGFHQTAEPKDVDKSWREYRLGKLELIFFYDEDGSTADSVKACRRVQVGTVTVEQPVYEVVCD